MSSDGQIKLIRLKEGILVEAEVVPKGNEAVASDLSDHVRKTLGGIRPALVEVCRPVIEAWTELNKDMVIEQAEVELGLSFEGEGNLYIAKAKTGATIKVKLTLKPPVQPSITSGPPPQADHSGE